MENKKIIIQLLVCMLIVLAASRSYAGIKTFAPILMNDHTAQSTRSLLAKNLYQKGLGLERGGDLLSALKLWLIAYNLEPGSELLFNRLETICRRISYLTHRQYEDAIEDAKYGRTERAAKSLAHLYKQIKKLDLALADKAAAALAETDSGSVPPVVANNSKKLTTIAWDRLERFNSVEDKINKGEYDDAAIELDAFLEQYPDYKEAELLYVRLEKIKQSGFEQTTVHVREKARVAGVVWGEFQRLEKEGLRREARIKLLELKDIYNGGEVLPAFLKNLDKIIAEYNDEIEKALQPDLIGIRRDYLGALTLEDSLERFSRLLKIDQDINRVSLANRDLRVVNELEANVGLEMEKSLRIILAQAETIKRLEGCRVAAAKYKEIRRIIGEVTIKNIPKERIYNCEE